MPPSSSGPGHQPFKLKIRGSNPLGGTTFSMLNRLEGLQLIDPDWVALRKEFPSLEKISYLNTCSLGLLSNRCRVATERYLDLWLELGASAWYSHWMDEMISLRAEFATLISSEIEEIALVSSISAGLTAVSSSLDFSNRYKVVTTELDFPTLAYHFSALQPRGVETIIVPSDDGVTVDIERLAKQVDEHTALLATSRVFFTTGWIQDIPALSKICKKTGTLLLVDDYQATGQVPLDIRKSGIDILLSGGLKWLLGGPGISYMYVRNELISSFQPTATGWFAQRDQFSFRVDSREYKEDARRFEAGTPSVASVYAGKAGVSLINEIGVENIRIRTLNLTKQLVEKLYGNNFSLRIPLDLDRHASITMIETRESRRVVEQLREEGIIVDSRPGGVRLSPYFYNDEHDIARVVSSLVGIREAMPEFDNSKRL